MKQKIFINYFLCPLTIFLAGIAAFILGVSYENLSKPVEVVIYILGFASYISMIVLGSYLEEYIKYRKNSDYYQKQTFKKYIKAHSPGGMP